MSVLRKDPLSHGWVIFSSHAVPTLQFQSAAGTLTSDACPYCAGHEQMTSPEIVAIRPQGSRPDGPGWTARLVHHPSAPFQPAETSGRRGEGLYDMMNSVGIHEVLIETKEHIAHFDDYAPEHAARLLMLLRDRMALFAANESHNYVLIHRNHGARAGCAIPHGHTNLLGLPIAPRWVRDEMEQAREYWTIKERCIFCDIAAQEQDGPRVVHQNEAFLAFAPFASRLPYEFWILPREHQHSFHQLPDDEIALLAEALQWPLAALRQHLNDPPYNLIVHSAPVVASKGFNTTRARKSDFYHWHIEILPRPERPFGFEYGTGFYENPVLPETAAEELRAHVDAHAARQKALIASPTA